MKIKLYLSVCLLLCWVAATAHAKSIYAAGYIEGEFTYVSTTEAGILKKIHVKKGELVEQGQLLFSLDTTIAEANIDAARAKLKQARAELANSQKGKRNEELEVILAQKEQAEAALRLSKRELARNEKLFKDGAISESRLDSSRANYNKDQARVEELEAAWKSATLGAREDEIRSAEANISITQAEVRKAERKLTEITPVAVYRALVQEIYFREGELVPVATPVVSLLSSSNIKLRFYIDEADIGRIKIGQQVTFNCDGCETKQKAKINFIASQLEYTPPQIYSIKNRQKFMFLIEAIPIEQKFDLHPGQPIDVEIEN